MDQPNNKWISNLDEFKASVDEFTAALGEFTKAYIRLQEANDKVSSFTLLFKDENCTLKGETLQSLRVPAGI